MSNLDQLRHAVGQLQQAYDRDYADLAERYGADAILIMTADERYVLLDALVTLVNARTALAQAEVVER